MSRSSLPRHPDHTTSVPEAPARNQVKPSVAVLPSGPGGRVEIKGKDAEGKPVQIAIDCPAFSPAVTDSSQKERSTH